MGTEPNEIRQQIEETRDRMGERADALTYKADVKSRVTDTLKEKRDSVTDFLGGKRQQLPSGDELTDQGRQAAGVVRDNPLVLAAGAAAIGLLVGLVIPSTEVENQRFGAAADSIKGRAVEAGQEALERGRHVAQDVAESATATAKESAGHHAGEFQETAQQKAQQAAEDARDNLSNS